MRVVKIANLIARVALVNPRPHLKWNYAKAAATITYTQSVTVGKLKRIESGNRCGDWWRDGRRQPAAILCDGLGKSKEVSPVRAFQTRGREPRPEPVCRTSDGRGKLPRGGGGCKIASYDTAKPTLFYYFYRSSFLTRLYDLSLFLRQWIKNAYGRYII